MQCNLQVKLLDFGSACLLNVFKGMKGNVGTTMYMSPESLTQEILYHKSSDMWSVGVVTYCLLTSSFPFKSTKDEEELKKEIISG